MKIGFIIYGSLDTLSGGYLYDRMLVEYLRAQGDTVEVISLPWRNYAAHLTDNLNLRLPNNLDILIQDELNHPSLIGANTAKHPYPVISLVHHLRCSEVRSRWQNDFYRLIEKKYLQDVDGFIFNSQTTQRVVNGLTEYCKPGIVAYPPTDRFGVAVSEDEIIERAKSDELRILFLGNLIERKGLQTLIEALVAGLHNIQPCRLDVVGSLTADPIYVKTIKDKIKTNGLASFIFLHGPLNDEALRQMFRQAHVLVVPSSYEGFGIVYLEGMGFGLPAIGTMAGAAGEIIEDGRTGFLIEPNNPGMLAERLSSLAKDHEMLTRLSINALHRYHLQPKWEQTAMNIREFLLSVITTFRKRSPGDGEMDSLRRSNGRSKERTPRTDR